MYTQLEKASVNGTIVPLTDAQIPATHSSFLTSYGVYESIQVDQGRPFHLTDHLKRLCQSANLLEMPLLYPLETLQNWANTLIEVLPQISYSLQILAFGADDNQSNPIIIFFGRPISVYPKTAYLKGGSAVTFSGERFLPECKSMNTLVNHLARKEAQKANALEALLTHNNQIFEGARSNLFAVLSDQTLVTAPENTVLAGVTRDVVINVMADTTTPVIETPIGLADPITELFITSTSMHVMPITRLNDTAIGDGQVGMVTKTVMERFERYYQEKIASPMRVEV